ncbi:Protease synthase and sporulation protein PAI 2 [Polystyrenella longa]|uniref:Protease synthase and sporulation protein PAI 2 n=1 Tax=Polystyrenella longa TaxID=2528007 RepID=A0A518CKD2_9PLAN|nr:FMN-binding negative transcriptional regulator [Polystyrenella longa]QDU79677.1 Protease synthase and sporulation protein PAI 2 [Polystyrenella longa]
MYIPQSFRETDVDILHDFIEEHSFATLITQQNDEPFSTHVPLLLDRTQGQFGRLIGHFATANPHSETKPGQSVLSIFHGPHAYISPTWYQESNTVPTWNYLAVHTYGRYQPVHESAQLLKILTQYVERYESDQSSPWTMQNNSSDFIEKLLPMIVGFTIDIERIEGKFKLSQNHSIQRRKNVVQFLKQQNDPDSQNIASLMESDLCSPE